MSRFEIKSVLYKVSLGTIVWLIVISSCGIDSEDFSDTYMFYSSWEYFKRCKMKI